MLFAGGLAGTILFGVPGLFVSRWPDPLRVVAVLSMALTLFSLPINVLVDTAQLARARKIVLTIVGIMCTIIAFLVAIVGVVFELAVLTVLNVDTFRTGFIGWLVIGFIDLVIAGWRVGLDSVLFDHARGA